MADTLEIFGIEYPNAAGIKATDDNDTLLSFIRPTGTKSITNNGSNIDVTEYAAVNVNVSSSVSLQSKSKSYTPTESAQSETVTYDNGYDGLSQVSVSVGAISSSYVGSGITRRSSTDLSASSATVTAPAGYYASSASKSVASGTEGTPTATKGTVSNHAISVTPSVTNTAGYISGGTHTGTAVTVSASELVSGSQTVTTNNTYDVTNLAELVVNVSGGGGSSMQTDRVEGGTMSASSITFTGLKGEPLYYSATVDNNVATGTPAKIAAITYDGTTLHGQTITDTTNAQVSYDGSSFSHSYSNGSLTITSTGASFVTGEAYFLDYAYGGSAANVNSEDVQVGSGATSITFTGLEGEPLIWSCIFKSNFGSSSGYQRVIFVNKTNTNFIIGYAMDSSAHISNSYWTATYNNGSLTITSQGTNAGGYFHQPGYYQLTYVIADASPYQKKTVTPTTSQQIVTADTGYDALSQVTVNAIPSSYVQPTSTVGATTYRASTSDQTIASGTYHSAQATIAAVTQTNLTAANIKSGTTISISNGQNNLWSVTGTYDGGGGGSSSIAIETMTNNSNQAQSIAFTLPSGRTPIAFFCRLTSTIQRSSNSRYYYCFDMRWDGSSSGGVAGNCFYMSSGQLTNITSGYSYSQSGTTFTLSSTGSRSASPGSFYNGTYELVYVY